MGILRIYLALCVISTHSAPVFFWQMHDGRQAVQIFFIISGFYMAMVLSSSRYATPRDFYLSRFLRIFPPYWIALTVTVLLSAAAGLIFQRWLLLSSYHDAPFSHIGKEGFLLSVVSNLILFGQDWVLFVNHDIGNAIHFTTNHANGAHPLWQYQLVPQCWTVGVELTFYILAPHLNRLSSRSLGVLALTTFVARLFTYQYLGLFHDPWTCRFFPFELGLFLFGMLGYRLYRRTAPYLPSPRGLFKSRLAYLRGGIILLLLLYLHVRAVSYISQFVGYEMGLWISYPLWALSIPALFFVFSDRKDDRIVGEMSYPIYLVHVLVIQIVTIILAHFHIEYGLGKISAILSTIVAVVFYRTIIAPLEKKRHALKSSPRSSSLFLTGR